MQAMPTADISHYTYRVTWSVEDQEFVATCLEFPSLSWLAATQVDALTGLETLIAEIVQDMPAQGEPIPDPLASAPTRANSTYESEKPYIATSQSKLQKKSSASTSSSSGDSTPPADALTCRRSCR